MKKIFLLTAVCVFCLLTNLSSQNVFNQNDVITNYDPSRPPAVPPPNTLVKWVRTQRSDIYFNTDKFKCYYYNGMPFRLRFPNNYNPNDLSKKYPVILLFHGIGEVAPATDNELQLYWGAQVFENKINEGLFNAFLLFPSIPGGNWISYFPNVNSILDLMAQYCNADPDRLINMGLSMGADATMYYTFANPKRSALTISSSPGSVWDFFVDPANYVHVPIWLASGGRDEYASPAEVQAYVDRVKNRGGDIRWTLYPEKGHGTWGEQWAEPYLIPYWQAAHKANPLIFYQQNNFPSGTAVNAKIGITQGFAEYQWQRNNTDIPNAVTNDIIVTQPGSYRARFRRIANGPWSDWSPNPAVISQTGTADNTAPGAPGNLRVVASTTNSVSLAWDNSTDNVGVAGYDIFVDGAKRYSSTNPDITAGNLNPNTSYTFTVQAHDLANNFSAFSNGVNGVTSGSIGNSPTAALSYKFYQGSFSTLPNFSTLTPVKTGTSSNIDISVRTAGVNDNFAFVWEGYINITTPGSYTFETISDDGSKLYFNSLYSPAATALVNNDGLHGAISATGTVNIPAAGTYPVAITFFEQGGGETMQVYWSGPGIGRQLIPGSAFADSGTPPQTGNGLGYKYYEGFFSSLPNFSTLTPVKTGTSPNVDLSVRTAGRNDNFAFVWEGTINMPSAGTYTFETISDDGSKLYFNSLYSAGATALVNNDGLHGAISATGTVMVPTAGSYPIAITFFEQSGGENMQVYWSGPGIGRQLVPNSAFGNSGITPPPTANGLSYKYYEGSFNALPNFSALSPVKTGNSATIDLSVRTAGRNDNFAFLWEGNINITTPGQYTFETVSDDGSKLYFNTSYSAGATALVNNDGLHAAVSATGTTNIPSAGSYPIAITFFEQGGGETMQVYWTGPGIPRQLIPAAAFGNNGTAQAPVAGLNYKYFEGSYNLLPNFNTLTPVKTGTSVNADIGVRNAGVNDNYAFLWEGYIRITNPGTYTFETVSDDGSKLYFNSLYSPAATALVNNDGLHAIITATGTVNIPSAGVYPIAISFFEQSGGENMQVYWTGPGIPRQLIPNSAFTVNNAATTDIVFSETSNSLTQSTELSLVPESLRVYPNPFRQSININFNNSSAGNRISVDLFDAAGRLLINKNFGNAMAGNVMLRMDLGGKARRPGVYFMRLNINGVQSKMVKLVRK